MTGRAGLHGNNTTSGRGPTSSYVLGVFVLATISLAFRLPGVDWGLPSRVHPQFTYHPDEAYHIAWARMLVDGEIIPKHFMYGGTLHYSVLNAYFNYARLLERHLGGENLLANTVLFGRYCSIAFSVITIILTAEIGRLIEGRRAGVLAALVLAISPAHIFLAQSVRPDQLSGLFAALMGYLAALMLRGPDVGRWRLFFVFGAVLGLATGLRFPLAAFGSGAIAAVLLRSCRSHSKAIDWRPIIARGCVIAVGMVVGYLLASPHTLVYFRSVIDGLAVQWSYQSGAFEDALGRGNGLFQYGWLMLREAFGLPFAAITIAGVISALAMRSVGQLLMLAMALPYFVLLTLTSWVVVRYMIPLLPFLAVIGSIGLLRAGSLLPSRLPLTLLIGAFVLWTTLQNLAFLRVQSGQNSREQVTEWMANHAQPGARAICLWQYRGDHFFCPAVPDSIELNVLTLDDESAPRRLEGDLRAEYLIVGEPIYANMERLAELHPKPAIRSLSGVLRDGGPYALVTTIKSPVRLAGVDFSGQFWSHDYQIINPGFRIYRRTETTERPIQDRSPVGPPPYP